MSEEVKIKYDEIKKKKTHRYCVFFIKDEKLIAVEKMAPRDANYEEFLGDLMACGPEDCRYGLYDFEYEHQCQVCKLKYCQNLARTLNIYFIFCLVTLLASGSE